MTPATKEVIRTRVLSALHDKRGTTFSFISHFLRAEWQAVADGSLVQTLRGGPHCEDAEGRICLHALCVMVDSGLATVCRLGAGPNARLATVQLHLQMTGVSLEGPLALEATFDGCAGGSALRQSFAGGIVRSAGGETVARVRATFVTLPPLAGTKLEAFPWEHNSPPNPPLSEAVLDPDERAILNDCDRALASCGDGRPFLEHFLNMIPREHEGGSHCQVAIRPALGNRVGHVQGGLLLALGASTANAAALAYPGLSSVSAFFMSPGRGESLEARSEAMHRGRSLTTIRTQVRAPGRALLLDVVSSHAA
ncbi:acyl-CoA thioesterase domain-containing protein [Mesorhizobium sp.]|uniref:acyl-CoA thioesterase domain-containing protein n=1 Tax=Mesorhizobium sp. TaxID=1871066 RepID=UPI000FE4670E|nr:acyl-CoA thioesterase domain-containing protein [Mesorhizobium sp.]RWJ05766.1 MAG: hypothetical protein EOR23_08005 [Mesorhizobium sp.]